MCTSYFIPTNIQIKTNTINELKSPIESLIFDINNTHHCGICNKLDNGSRMICCDGPRPITDPNNINEKDNLLCNQWYHYDCLNWDINKNINKLEPFFGPNCKHNIWFNSLNNNYKNIVKEKINLLRNNIDINEYKKEKQKMKCLKVKNIDISIRNEETRNRINRIKNGINNKNKHKKKYSLNNNNNKPFIKKYKYKLKK